MLTRPKVGPVSRCQHIERNIDQQYLKCAIHVVMSVKCQFVFYSPK